MQTIDLYTEAMTRLNISVAQMVEGRKLKPTYINEFNKVVGEISKMLLTIQTRGKMIMRGLNTAHLKANNADAMNETLDHSIEEARNKLREPSVNLKLDKPMRPDVLHLNCSYTVEESVSAPFFITSTSLLSPVNLLGLAEMDTKMGIIFQQSILGLTAPKQKQKNEIGVHCVIEYFNDNKPNTRNIVGNVVNLILDLFRYMENSNIGLTKTLDDFLSSALVNLIMYYSSGGKRVVPIFKFPNPVNRDPTSDIFNSKSNLLRTLFLVQYGPLVRDRLRLEVKPSTRLVKNRGGTNPP